MLFPVPSYTYLALEFSKIWACGGENRNSLLKLYRHESAQLAHYEQQCHMTASRQVVASSVGIGVLSGINGMKATSCCLSILRWSVHQKGCSPTPRRFSLFPQVAFCFIVLHVFDQTVCVLALLLSTIERVMAPCVQVNVRLSSYLIWTVNWILNFFHLTSQSFHWWQSQFSVWTPPQENEFFILCFVIFFINITYIGKKKEYRMWSPLMKIGGSEAFKHVQYVRPSLDLVM